MTEGAEAKRLTLVLKSGKAASLVQSDGDKTVILSPESSPPGSTVEGRIEGISVAFQLKVKSCQRIGEHFSISGRTQNATKEMRERLKGG